MSSDSPKSKPSQPGDALPMAPSRHHAPPSAADLRPTPMHESARDQTDTPVGQPAADVGAASSAVRGAGSDQPVESGVDRPSTGLPASGGSNTEGGALDPRELEEAVIEQLKTCYDPEIPIDIYELGLIYTVKASPEGDVAIEMTLTSPACPVAGTLPGEVEQKVRTTPGVRNVSLELVWDPPWDQEMMSEAAKLTLGFM